MKKPASVLCPPFLAPVLALAPVAAGFALAAVCALPIGFLSADGSAEAEDAREEFPVVAEAVEVKVFFAATLLLAGGGGGGGASVSSPEPSSSFQTSFETTDIV